MRIVDTYHRFTTGFDIAEDRFSNQSIDRARALWSAIRDCEEAGFSTGTPILSGASWAPVTACAFANDWLTWLPLWVHEQARGQPLAPITGYVHDVYLNSLGFDDGPFIEGLHLTDRAAHRELKLYLAIGMPLF